MSRKEIQRKHIPRAEIIEACRRFHGGAAPTPDVALAGKYPAKVILARMEQMIGERLLECGVSTRTAWVVEKPQETAR